MIRALALATALVSAPALSATAQEAPDRYAIHVTVMEAGVQIAAGRTTIAEGSQAEILLTGADGQYAFTADLQVEQGDGADGRLVLEAHLNHDGTDLASPRMIMKRGGTARMTVGSVAQDMALTEGIEVEIAPVSAR